MRQHVTVWLLPTLALAALGGCATTAPHGAAGPAAPAPAVAATPTWSRLQVATAPMHKDVLTQLLDAQFALDHNDLAAAAAAYARATALSDNPEVAARAAELAVATHDPAAARQAIARWVALGGKGLALTRVRAQLALDTGDTDTARKQLLALVGSKDPNAWRMFGRILMGARDIAQAGQLLRAIATPEHLPDDPKAWLAMSEMGSKMRQTAYARQLADAAVRKFACAECYAWAAQLRYAAGDAKAARSLYAQALAKAPDSSHVRTNYAALLARSGDDAAAARVLAHGPQDAKTFQLRAAYAARAQDQDELKRIYAQLKQAQAKVRQHSYYLLGQLAGVVGQERAARDWFAKVPSTSEHAFDARLRTAVLWQRTGNVRKAHALARQLQADYADAPEQLRKALQLDAELYMGQRQFTQAASHYSKALQVAPGDNELLYARGVARAEAGQTDAALADLRAVLKAEPDNIDAANALGFTLADAGRDLEQAQALIERARQARPDDPAITDSWGWLQYRLGHLAAAEKALRKAWQVGHDPEVGGHLATVLWHRGQHAQARRVLTAARKLAPHDARLEALQASFSP